MNDSVLENWDSGSPYERYVGRWSRKIAQKFLTWLAPTPYLQWGDVGCGTGALVNAVITFARPTCVYAIDRAKGFIAEAKHRITDNSVQFMLADAGSLPWATASCDMTVSGLVLNFLPDPLAAVREMVRVTQSKGKVAVYVWDYSDGMQMMRYFWDAVKEVNPENTDLDEAERFPICRPEPLLNLFREAGLTSARVVPIEITTRFKDFDDFWSPFLGKQGAAPTYLATLDQKNQLRIREILESRIKQSIDGSIPLLARAWAVQGTV